MSDDEYLFKYVTAFERFGLKRNRSVFDSKHDPLPEQESVRPVSAEDVISNIAEDPYGDSPEKSKKRKNGDIVRVDGFDIEHGSLIGYFGDEKDLTVPNAAVVIPSTAFTNCRLFVESIDLNRAGCVLDHAFSDCPKLHTVKVPPTVTTFKLNAFSNCPNVTLYARHGQLPAGFEDRFRGKAIVYLDDENVLTDTKVSEARSAESLPKNEHKWGNFIPKGTAYIKTKDGTVHTAVANSLILCSEGITNRIGPELLQGFQSQNDTDGNNPHELINFADIQTVTANEGLLTVTDIDGKTTSVTLHAQAELWCIGENSGVDPLIIKATEIAEISFDRSQIPSYKIHYVLVTLKEGCFLSPAAFIWLNCNINANGINSVGVPRLKFMKDLSKIAPISINLKRVRKITVTQNGKEAVMLELPTDMKMKVLLKNGEEVELIMLNRFDHFYAMSAYGVMRSLSRETLKEIDMYPHEKQ